MKKSFTFSVLIISALALAAATLTPSDVVKEPEKFDQKVIKVRGIVKKFKAKTSKAGNPYLTFELTSGSDKVSIFSQGKLEKDLVDGDKVEVEGKFTKLKTVGSATYKNEVDVTAKKGEKPKITPIK